EVSRKYALGIQLTGGATPFQKGVESQIHAIGSDDGSGIDSLPAALREPDFAPGMGICLSHEKEVSNLVILAAQVTGNDARWNSGQSHQGGETGGVVLAKSKAAMKKEFIEVVLSVFAR